VLPDVPAIGEFVAGYEAAGWHGLGAPKNTPMEIVSNLNNEINAGLADPRIKTRFADLASTVFPGSPPEFGKFIAKETDNGARWFKFAGMKAD
jgi:tripartite-type tricarboxylate transporter receptor subunit TctC